MNVQLVDFASPEAPRIFADSMLDSGFAVISKHNISDSEISSFYQAWEHFFVFGEPEEFLSKGDDQAGYFPTDRAETAKGNTVQDLKEYFQYWPGTKLPLHLTQLTQSFFTKMISLGLITMQWLQDNTDSSLWHKIDRPFPEYLSKEHTLLRVLRYPPIKGPLAPKALRAAAHEDINLITLLPAADEPGLELKSKSSDDWFPLEAPAGSIVVNIGDMLQELTDGSLPSTSHRVVNPKQEHAQNSRMTAPVFCHPRPELILSERYSAEDYLSERLKEINRRV
ncbi:isopenicillin N synthase family oxygenase [Gammaproteobacteria bacterium]|nr:isopenicillin N synthase family oxygenase [Gammaproteobacteria bacterium]